jgi:[ribosomal protein S5]-alanine N-acetyltransferase
VLAPSGLPIVTDRLVLRPPEGSDAQALLAIFSDPEVTRYWATPPWTTTEQAVARIEQDRKNLDEGSAVSLVLQPADGGAILGRVALFAFVEGSQRAELGYVLARRAWGKGLNHEALRAFLGYGFSQLALRRVEADIDPRNERSARTLERLGFTREGYLRERWVVGGEVSDTALYGLLSKDWYATQAQREA